MHNAINSQLNAHPKEAVTVADCNHTEDHYCPNSIKNVNSNNFLENQHAALTSAVSIV